MPHFTVSDIFLGTGAAITIITVLASLFTDRASVNCALLGSALMLVGAFARAIEWTSL